MIPASKSESLPGYRDSAHILNLLLTVPKVSLMSARVPEHFCLSLTTVTGNLLCVKRHLMSTYETM